jgi:para-nitrobenzyl esterase
VQTKSGALRGYVDNGVQVFKGIPYGASTAGANRFMPPRKLQAWTGVRDAFEYGGRSPQILGGEPAEMLSTDPREALSEDCLMLNLWTPEGRSRQASGDGVAARRRLRQRLGQLHDLLGARAGAESTTPWPSR